MMARASPAELPRVKQAYSTHFVKDLLSPHMSISPAMTSMTSPPLPPARLLPSSATHPATALTRYALPCSDISRTATRFSALPRNGPLLCPPPYAVIYINTMPHADMVSLPLPCAAMSPLPLPCAAMSPLPLPCAGMSPLPLPCAAMSPLPLPFAAKL
ncbi:unnamed protein product [Closterium sp. Naga37s-1]|nr:unnamed protein product [Closterium sp. Naga37s-1]